MPYKPKDRQGQSCPVWWASYTDASGQRIRRSTGTADLTEAKALEAKWKLEAHNEKKWGREPERSFDSLMLEYLKSHSSKRSADRDKEITRNLLAHFRGKVLNSLGAANIRAYIEERKVKGTAPATINRELALLSAALNYARRELEWNIPNPVSGRKLKEPEGRVRWLTKVEASELIKSAESEKKAPYLADFIRLALNTGMRRGELLGLEWKRVDLKTGLIHLEAMHTKAGKRRTVPLNQKARSAILSRLQFRASNCEASPWVFCDNKGNRIGSLRKAFMSACKRVEIDDFTIHDLRHTCAAWLVSEGAQLAAVRDLLGHSTIKMTERYAHLAPENVREAVSLLDGQSRSGHVNEKKAAGNYS
ncbi:MAG: recombinase XerD [Candidatus Methylumidiphilus alinenensis]|uniref:Recombinase XerD n=1 Tax=Candidatus Methylumidiphilus alinenensis TaxID=2202197 RepID=A0A2W4QVK5_9GAMM|nr:MAG: recombinase XerD [Candidatus Methylumidiphilus alinenensis]